MASEHHGSGGWRARFIREIPAPVALFDRELRYVAASPAWIAAFGLPETGIAGQAHGQLCAAGNGALAQLLRAALAGQTGGECVIAGPLTGRAVVSADPHRDEDGAVAGVVAALREASPVPHLRPDRIGEIRQREDFAAALQQALADPQHRPVVAVAIGLDNLHELRNLHGAAFEQQVVGIVGERLVRGKRTNGGRSDDMLARLGPDSFGLLCGTPAASPREAEQLANRLRRTVQNPLSVDGLTVRLSASIGFIAGAEERDNAEQVLQDLELTVQQARMLGHGKALCWTPSLTREATRRYAMAEQLRQAFDNGELMLHYQPILRLHDHQLVGAEALLRWNHPSEGLVASAAFVPVLEETGLIVEAGIWAMREAVRQLEAWHMLYGRHIVDWVSVNLSPRQFGDAEPLLAALRAMHAGGLSVHRLQLEIGEAALMRTPEATRAVLDELHAMGIRFAVDDFGTGYSSVQSLRQYPVDVLKIDRDFTAQIGTAEGERLAQALLEIARMHGAAIIAEGIETAAQRDFLRDGGCAFGQGFLFAEPMDGALFGAYALTHAVRPAAPGASGGVNPVPSANRSPAA